MLIIKCEFQVLSVGDGSDLHGRGSSPALEPCPPLELHKKKTSVPIPVRAIEEGKVTVIKKSEETHEVGLEKMHFFPLYL